MGVQLKHVVVSLFAVALAAQLGACIFEKGDYEGGGRRSGGGEPADSGQAEESGVTVNIVINLGDAAK